MVKLARASQLFKLKDILDIKNDKRYRVSRTPFGATYSDPMLYAGNAVPWKGVKGIDNVRKINAGVADGLENAIRISKKKAGVYGVVCIVDPVTGMPKCMPRKAYEQMKEAGKVAATIPVM